MVTGVRLVMVRRSLRAGKPSPERLKQLNKEFLTCSIAGIIVWLIGGLAGLFGTLPIELAKTTANTGAVLFGLGIPQRAQWYCGKGTEVELKESTEQLRKLAWGVAIFGAALVLGSGILSSYFGWK